MPDHRVLKAVDPVGAIAIGLLAPYAANMPDTARLSHPLKAAEAATATDRVSPDAARVIRTREALLTARIRNGDPAAEDELVRTYRRAVLLIAAMRTRNSDVANDLCQDVLIAVLKALRAGMIRNGEKLSAFIHGTARNIINYHLRSCARHPESGLETVEALAADSVERMESSERQRLMRQELTKCSVTDRRILLLSLVEGHSLVEVAARLHLTHDAVRARKSRLIRKFTKKFAAMSQK